MNHGKTKTSSDDDNPPTGCADHTLAVFDVIVVIRYCLGQLCSHWEAIPVKIQRFAACEEATWVTVLSIQIMFAVVASVAVTMVVVMAQRSMGRGALGRRGRGVEPRG